MMWGRVTRHCSGNKGPITISSSEHGPQTSGISILGSLLEMQTFTCPDTVKGNLQSSDICEISGHIQVEENLV